MNKIDLNDFEKECLKRASDDTSDGLIFYDPDYEEIKITVNGKGPPKISHDKSPEYER